MVPLIIVFLGCLIISFVVFGGAQVFIPYFKILLVNILDISDETWNSVLSIANSTPGVFGLKLAFISGFLAGEGHWWAYLAMFITYLIFIIVPIFLMIWIMNKFNKVKNKKFTISLYNIMKPVLCGVLAAVAINLIMSLVVPFLGFNELSDNFGQLDKYIYFKDTFFTKWRYWVLIAWSILSIIIDYVLIMKYKTNIFLLIVINITLCMIIFQPWI